MWINEMSLSNKVTLEFSFGREGIFPFFFKTIKKERGSMWHIGSERLTAKY